MFNWLTRTGLTTRTARSRVVPRIVEDRYPKAGEYELLYKYLRDRYANRVVLTFAEIEDLLGFSLPALARLQFAWWDGGDFAADPSHQSLAWMLAGRTATVNMPAQSVVFDRDLDP
jgi:hypothetical protein